MILRSPRAIDQLYTLLTGLRQEAPVTGKFRGWRERMGTRELLRPDVIPILTWKQEGGKRALPAFHRCNCLETTALAREQLDQLIASARFIRTGNISDLSKGWTDWHCPVCRLRAEHRHFALIRLVTDARLRSILLKHDWELMNMVRVLNPAITEVHLQLITDVNFGWQGLPMGEIIDQSRASGKSVRKYVKDLVAQDTRADHHLFGVPYPFISEVACGGIRMYSLTDIGRVIKHFLK